MTVRLFLLALGSITLSAMAQITLRAGMSSSSIHQMLAQEKICFSLILCVAKNCMVIMGLFMYAVSAVLWLLVLARLDVSVAYPFVGLGFVITMLLGYFLLGEAVGILRVVGTLLILAGIILVARS